MRRFRPLTCAIAFVSAAATTGTHATQDAHAHGAPVVPAAILERPIGARTGIGDAHDPTGTSFKDAQAMYDQGLAFLHAYSWIDAARSFHQALRRDPSIAMAHVGLSYAEYEIHGLAASRAALDNARRVRRLSDYDRLRIELRAKQLEAVADRSNVNARAAYVRALDAALAAPPRADTNELLLLRGMAEDPDPAGRGMGAQASAIPYFERALQGAVNTAATAAAHHYLTHALENAGRIEDALAHGARFAALAPRIPHAHHMYGHDLRRVGRIDEAIAQFRAAYDLEMDPARVREVPPAYDWHHQHNLDLLAASHQYIGQMSAAEPLLRRSFGIASPFVIQEFNKREWPAFLVATGRAEDALAAARLLVASPAPLVTAGGRIAEGRALVALGRYNEAAAASNAAMQDLDRAGPEASLAAADLKALQAEFFIRTGQHDRARPLVEDAVRRIRAQPGPDAWSQGLFSLDALARAAVFAGDWEIAEFLGAQMREHDPAYGGTHYLLALVADHKQDRETARRELEAAKRAWSRADNDFAPRRDIDARLQRLRSGVLRFWGSGVLGF